MKDRLRAWIGKAASGYLVAVMAIAVVVLVRLVLLGPLFPKDGPLLLFIPAVLFSAWWGGLGPGLAATLLGLVADACFFLDPVDPLLVFEIRGGIFAVIGVLMSWLTHVMRSAQLRAELSRQQTLGKQRRLEEEMRDRAHAEATLRLGEERFRLLAEAVPSIIWTAAPDGTITYVNEQWFRYTGIRPEHKFLWPELVLHPADRERCLAQWSRALREGTEYDIEVRNRRYDGEYRWFLTRAAPVRDASGRLVACSAPAPTSTTASAPKRP